MTMPYSGGSRANIPLPHEPAATAAASPASARAVPPRRGKSTNPVDDTRGGGGAPAQPADETAEREGDRDPFENRSRSRSGLVGGLPRPVNLSGLAGDGAAILFGFLVWTWVALPLLDGGPARVRDVWRAKLTNVGPDGEELP